MYRADRYSDHIVNINLFTDMYLNINGARKIVLTLIIYMETISSFELLVSIVVHFDFSAIMTIIIHCIFKFPGDT